VTLPLDGMVVVSLEQAIAAPLATRHLADLGATVLKVERPGGDFARRYDDHVQGESSFFVWANRGKQSVVMDIKEERDDAVALIGGADVFVHNLSPRAAADLGLTAKAMGERFPSLVAAEISGYGLEGPRAGDKAYDLCIQAEAGVLSVTGDEQMSKAGFSVADIAAGMYAYSSILAALVRRERTGEGAVIHVSMLDCLVEWMSAPLYSAVHTGQQPPRTGRRHHSIAPYGTFVLADGSTVLIAVQNDAEWRRLANDVLDSPDLAVDARFLTNQLRLAHVAELEPLVAASLADSEPDRVLARLDEARIAVARVRDLESVWQHEQLRTRGRIAPVLGPQGPVDLLRPPFDISDSCAETSFVPALGEHDPALLVRLRERSAQQAQVR
jgi:itaconate CoA-transferase